VLAVLALAAAGCGPAKSGVRGVLIVTLDTTRRDRLSCYGDGAIETPAIDALARRGARFECAVSPVPLTLPSHTTILSGVLPPGHQVFENGHYHVGPRLPLLASALAERGFVTGAFVGAMVLGKEYGLDRGFATYDDAIEVGKDRLIAERKGDVVTDRALAWLGARLQHDDGFFLWVHLFDPHQPHEPPEPFRTRYAKDLYRGEIAFCDAQVGRLIAALEQAHRLESTLVVVTADHGESLGEHGEDSHGLFVYDATALVPLVIAGPGVRAGSTIPGQVSLADVAPTVLSCCGLEPPAGLSGSSLCPLLEGGTRDALEARPAYLETRYCALHFGWAPLVGIRTEAFKFIAAPRPELYDLRADPGESENLCERRPDVVAAMRRALAEVERDAARVDGGTTELRMTTEMRGRMQALGYVASGTSAPAPSGPARKDPKDMVAVYHRLNRLPGYEKVGRLAERIAESRLVLREDPENPSALEHLGVSLAVCGRFDEAVEPLSRALDRGEETLEVRYRLGVSYFQLGDDVRAQPQLERCLVLDPSEPIAYRYLGLIADRAGDTSAAIARYRKFLELYRGDPKWSSNIEQRLKQIEGG
jgi:arylsulfatase A-like enzyme